MDWQKHFLWCVYFGKIVFFQELWWFFRIFGLVFEFQSRKVANTELECTLCCLFHAAACISGASEFFIWGGGGGWPRSKHRPGSSWIWMFDAGACVQSQILFIILHTNAPTRKRKNPVRRFCACCYICSACALRDREQNPLWWTARAKKFSFHV